MANARLCGDGRRRRHRPLLGLALVAVAIFAVPAGASEPASPAIGRLDCEPSAEALQDIAAIAEQRRLDLDEAIARYGWQGCFSEAAGYLASTCPETYAGAAVADDGRRAWIAFVGEVPTEAAELVAAIPVPVELIGDRDVSEAQLNETLQAIHRSVSQHEDGVAAGGSFDVETGVVTIQIQPRATLSRAERAQLVAALQAAQPVSPHVTVEMIAVDELGGGLDSGSSGGPSVARTIGYGLLAAGALVALGAGLSRARRRRTGAVPR